MSGYAPAMVHFLLVYDRRAGQLLHEESYSDGVEALLARFQAEADFRDDPRDVEIVVLGARSRDDLLRTHGRYFRSLAELLTWSA